MVDIDRGPDPRDLLAGFIAGLRSRFTRVDGAADAAHDRDTATTAHYLADDQETT